MQVSQLPLSNESVALEQNPQGLEVHIEYIGNANFNECLQGQARFYMFVLFIIFFHYCYRSYYQNYLFLFLLILVSVSGRSSEEK